MGAQEGYLDFHTVPELSVTIFHVHYGIFVEQRRVLFAFLLAKFLLAVLMYSVLLPHEVQLCRLHPMQFYHAQHNRKVHPRLVHRLQISQLSAAYRMGSAAVAVTLAVVLRLGPATAMT